MNCGIEMTYNSRNKFKIPTTLARARKPKNTYCQGSPKLEDSNTLLPDQTDKERIQELLNLDESIFSSIQDVTQMANNDNQRNNVKRKLERISPQATKRSLQQPLSSSINHNIQYVEEIEKSNESVDMFSEFFATQCIQQMDEAVASIEIIPSPPSSACITQFFDDTQFEHGLISQEVSLNEVEEDVSKELHDPTNVAIQCSQRFLSDANNMIDKVLQITSTNRDQIKNVVITENYSFNSKYIERTNTITNSNEKLEEDLQVKLSQTIHSTQYKEEIEVFFNNCEQTVCQFGEEDQEPSIISGVNDINWNNEFFETQAKNVSPTKEHIIPLSNKSKRNGSVESASIRRRFLPTPVASSLFYEMGPFFGLPLKVKKMISEIKGINDLYDWQKECLNLPAIERRKNLIYALPTSGGKTLVAEILILREIICRHKNVLFVLPYISIVQEKLSSLAPFAVSFEFLVEEYAAGKGCLPPRKRRKKSSVFIATIEKSLVLLDSLIEVDRANEIGLIVVDELHIIGDGSRGAVLESLLTKAMFIKAGIQIVGMSATIGNLNEISEFMNADVYCRDFRPVELREYIKCGADILEFVPNALTVDEAFTLSRSVDYSYKGDFKRMDPDHITGLVSEVIPEASCLIFCATKKNCENVALLIANVITRKLIEHRKPEKDTLIKLIEQDSGPLCQILKQTLPLGIAYHHSGLAADERKHLEEAFRLGILCVICCTSTLAAGVNLPAKRVILRSPYVGRDFITLSRYKQMIGRAGRAGLGETGESILICPPKDNIRVCNLLRSAMDEAVSSLNMNEYKALEYLFLSAIGLKIATCRNELERLTNSTLLSIQAQRHDLNIPTVTSKVIESLMRSKAILLTNELTDSSKVLEETTKTGRPKLKVVLRPSTILKVSQLGKSIFKAGINLEKANSIQKDLQKAQQSLVLVDYTHLLYIVTPYDQSEISVVSDWNLFYSRCMRLQPHQMITAKLLGINESCLMKMISGKQLKTEVLNVLNRFFLTLILYELWNLKPIHQVASEFQVNRGMVQGLISTAATYANSVQKFCEEMDEFWAFKELLGGITKRLSNCCALELEPLMELPAVKTGRARQLFNSGYKNIQSIAKAQPKELVEKIEYMNFRIAKQLIAGAKLLLLERVETLREQAQDVLDLFEHRVT